MKTKIMRVGGVKIVTYSWCTCTTKALVYAFFRTEKENINTSLNGKKSNIKEDLQAWTCDLADVSQLHFFLDATLFKNNKVSLNKETCLNQLKCFQSLIDSIIWFFMKTSIRVITCFAFNCNITATRFFSEKNVKFKLRLTRSSSWVPRIRKIVSACNKLKLASNAASVFPLLSL